MKIYGVLLALALPVCALQAQTQPVDCSQRTAEDYVPMTRTDRAANYIRGLVFPQAFFYAGALAGIDQWMDRPKEWGEGSLGYERRYGNAFARDLIGTSLQDGFALGLDEDNRYFVSGEEGFGRRLAYAVTSPFLARHSDGRRTLSFSALGGVAGASAIQEIWQPRSTSGAGNAAIEFGLTFAFRVGLDVAREFAPRPFEGLLK